MPARAAVIITTTTTTTTTTTITMTIIVIIIWDFITTENEIIFSESTQVYISQEIFFNFL